MYTNFSKTKRVKSKKRTLIKKAQCSAEITTKTKILVLLMFQLETQNSDLKKEQIYI